MVVLSVAGVAIASSFAVVGMERTMERVDLDLGGSLAAGICHRGVWGRV